MVLTTIGLVTVACALSKPTPTPSQEAIEAQRTVDTMAALRQDMPFPEHFKSGDAARTGDEFDVTRYFTVITSRGTPLTRDAIALFSPLWLA